MHASHTVTLKVIFRVLQYGKNTVYVYGSLDEPMFDVSDIDHVIGDTDTELAAKMDISARYATKILVVTPTNNIRYRALYTKYGVLKRIFSSSRDNINLELWIMGVLDGFTRESVIAGHFGSPRSSSPRSSSPM